MATLPESTDLHGLHVDLGHYSPAAGRWLREPYAEYTCGHGRTVHATGADQVTSLCRSVAAWRTGKGT